MLQRAGRRPAVSAATDVLTTSSPKSHSASLHFHSAPLLAKQKNRADGKYRKEWFQMNGAKETMVGSTFREYASTRRSEDQKRINRDLPSLLSFFQTLSAKDAPPTKAAYLYLLEAASLYSIRRSGGGAERIHRQLEAAQAQEGVNAPSLPLPNKDVNMTFGVENDWGLGWKIAWSAWEDARLGGIDLGITGFDFLLKAASPHARLLPHLLAHLATTSSPTLRSITPATYSQILRSSINSMNPDGTLMHVLRAQRRGVSLEEGKVDMVVRVLTEWGHARLALELVEKEVRERGMESVGMGAWMDVLRCSADLHYTDGVEQAWERVMQSRSVILDEGLCISVLNVAGRAGLPDLATSVFQVLTQQKIPLQEHHLAPLLESYCGAGRLTEAMEVLEIMRSSAGIAPDLKTAQPLVHALKKSTATLDSAFFALDGMKTMGKTVDVAAFNAVLKACALSKEAPRAVAIYGQAGSLGVRPNTETYNTLLEICIEARARKQADVLLKDMENPKPLPTDPEGYEAKPIPWDINTYENIITVCLTQPDYEDAFFYLEKMKGDRIRPPLSVYERLTVKCLSAGDGRAELVQQEMQQNSYRPSETLRAASQRAKQGQRVVYETYFPGTQDLAEWRKGRRERERSQATRRPDAPNAPRRKKGGNSVRLAEGAQKAKGKETDTAERKDAQAGEPRAERRQSRPRKPETKEE